MEAICQWCFSTKCFDMLKILLIVSWKWNFEADVLTVNEWEQLLLLENGYIHDVLKVSLSKSTIPIVDNMSAVHDLPEDVNQILEWNLRRSTSSLHISIKHKITISQISHIERIAHIPSERTKSLSFNHSRMEEAKTK